MEQFFTDLWDTISKFAVTSGAKLLGAIVLLVVGLKLVKRLARRIENGKGFKKLNVNVQSFAKSGLVIALDAIVILTAVSILGVPMASIVALIGSCGVTIGLALQGGLSNLAGGLMVLLFHPFKVGDLISNGSYTGVVEEIGIFYTTIRTGDNREVLLPNGTVTGNALVNESYNETRRMDYAVPLGYGVDPALASRVLLTVAKETPNVLENPAPQLYLDSFGDSSLNYKLRLWCPSAKYYDVKVELGQRISDALAAAGVTIPYPQLDVHMDKDAS